MSNPTDIPGSTLDLNFMIPGSLPAGLTFTRSTTGTYLDINGLLQTAAIDTPRWDYDPVAKTLKGMLIENARTNNFLWSGDFTNAAWTKGAATLNTSAMLGPNGPNTGVGVIANSGVIGYLSQNYNFAASAMVTVSCFVKAGAATSVYFLLSSNLWNDAVNRTAMFDLQAGTVTSTQGTTASASISPAGNGWYRCSLTATPENTLTSGPQFRTVANGDGVATQFWAFGAQVEIGSTVSSYIPTTTATVPRSHDGCKMPLGAWFTAGPVSMCGEFMVGQSANLHPVNTREVVVISDESTANRIALRAQAVSTSLSQPIAYTAVVGVASISTSLGATPANTPLRIAGSWDGTVGNAILGTGAVVNYPAPLPTQLTALVVGNYATTGNYTLLGHIRRVTYWPRALTNLELQKVSAPEPADSPALTLDFMAPGVLPTGVVFTRASTGTYLDIDGLLQTAAINAPRWDYDPVARTLKGMLIEEARTNVLTNSRAISLWTPLVDTTVTDNSIASPDGTVNASLCVEGVAGNASISAGNFTVAAGSTLSYSYYLKRGNQDIIELIHADNAFANGITSWVNVATGVVLSTQPRGTATNITSSVEPCLNGWYRFKFTCTMPGTSTTALVQIRSAVADGSATRVNNATYYVWGAQVEVGTFPTSLIPTSGATVTRAVDVATMPLAGVFVNDAPASFVTSAIFQGTGIAPASRYVFRVDDNSDNNRYLQYNPTSSTQIQGFSVVANVPTVAATATTSIPYGSVLKMAAVYTATSISQEAHGKAVSTATHSGGLATGIVTLRVGAALVVGTGVLGGWMQRLSYWPRALTNAEMIAETGEAYRMQATVAS